MIFKSLRTYPITLTNPQGQVVVVYPGQNIDLPEDVGLRFNGLLHPVYEANTVEVKVETPKPIVKEVKTEKIVEVEIEDEEKEEISEILQETMKIANERKAEKKAEAKKAAGIEEQPKRKAGRPKKEK